MSTKQVVVGGTTDQASTTSTEYAGIMGGMIGGWNTTEANRRQQIPGTVTVQDLQINLQTAPGSGKSRTFTVMKNGSATGVTVTVSDTSTSGSDTTNKVGFTAGDDISLRSEVSGTPAASRIRWACVFLVPSAKTVLISGTKS